MTEEESQSVSVLKEMAWLVLRTEVLPETVLLNLDEYEYAPIKSENPPPCAFAPCEFLPPREPAEFQSSGNIANVKDAETQLLKTLRVTW
jgi:hypothetical protein